MNKFTLIILLFSLSSYIWGQDTLIYKGFVKINSDSNAVVSNKILLKIFNKDSLLVVHKNFDIIDKNKKKISLL